MTRILYTTIIGLLFFSCQPSGNDQGQEGTNADTSSSSKQEKVELHLPKPSPEASVFQRVGVTDVKIHYYRPSVRDRIVWGNPVKLNEMWRTGANKATTFDFSTDVKVNGHRLKAGQYSFFTIPRKNKKWTVIFNKKTDLWGTSGYTKKHDALRFQLATDSTYYHEMMTFEIRNVTNTKADINLIWKNTRLPLKLTVATDKLAMAQIEEAISKASDDNWEVYADAADYCIETEQQLEKAEKWIDKALSIKEYWYSYWTKAQLMAVQENYDKAVEIGKQAIKAGEKQNKEFSYKKHMQKQIKEWKNK